MKQSSALVPAERSFSITKEMKKGQIGEAIQAAKDFYFRDPLLPLPKRVVLEACFKYADQYLHSVWGRDNSRYGIYTNIVNFCGTFDTVHFLLFAQQEAQKLDAGEFRNVLLPVVTQQLRLSLVQTIQRQRRMFMSLAVGFLGMGLASMRTGGVVGGMALAMLMIAGYIFSEQIVRERLNQSLEIKMAQLTGHNIDYTQSINDGAETFFVQVEHYAERALRYGTRMFGRVLPALPAEQPRVVALTDAQVAELARVASAPPHRDIGVSDEDARQAFPPKKESAKQGEEAAEKLAEQSEKAAVRRPGKVAVPQ